jgi:uncharacterized protein (DUF849 family)
MAINTNVVVTCAVTGAGDTVDKHPAIPVTPEQIANSAIEAADAGAAIVHLHVRDPETGKGSRDINLFKETVDLVRNSGRNVLINLTAGMGGDLVVDDDNPHVPGEGTDLISAEQRMAHVEMLRPDIATLDCGTINFDNANYVYVQTPNMLRTMAARYAEIGVKPEMEVFDLGRAYQRTGDVSGLSRHSLGGGRGSGDDDGNGESAAPGCCLVRIWYQPYADADGGSGHAAGRQCPCWA